MSHHEEIREEEALQFLKKVRDAREMEIASVIKNLPEEEFDKLYYAYENRKKVWLIRNIIELLAI